MKLYLLNNRWVSGLLLPFGGIFKAIMIYSFEDSLGRLTKVISQGLGREMSRRLEQKNISVSPLEWCVLSMLYGSVGVSQSAIGQFLGFNKVNVLRIVRTMENMGLVVRTVPKRDKRYRLVKLTRLGEEQYRLSAGLASETIIHATRGISDSEYQQALDLLKRIASNISQE